MERMKRRWNAWLNGKSGAYAVVEATILFPIIMMVFAGLFLLSVYLPTRTILQRGTQYAAEGIATARSDTWVAFETSTPCFSEARTTRTRSWWCRRAPQTA